MVEPDNQEYLESLDIDAAKARGDDDRIISISTAALNRMLNNETIDGAEFAGSHYVRAMHRQGRSQEAANFLTSLVPNVFDATSLPANWEEGNLKFACFQLLTDLESRDKFIEIAKTYVATVDAAGIPWRTNKVLLTNAEFMLGNFEEARSVFLELVGESGPTDYWWNGLLENPWLSALREDPEVKSVLDKREREMVEIRKQVINMMQGPEWPH